MSEVVKVSMQGGIAVVTVDSPPVNTLSREVRAGLKSAFESLRGKPEVKAVVLACAGKTFLSGGDMREFETGVQEPGYHEVLRLIEDSAVPVVAALYGTVMGGGLETAIACHYRVAQEGVKLGLPEITLGIIPGAGGTQRMPRLIGLEKALDMMLSAKPLTAAEAVKVSLVDTAVAGDVTAAAVAYARDLVASGKGPRRTREMSVEG
ncbi:MAG: enoyl-CoA hydratase/isomerase family protein, partial [Burkholderiales bacterium]|nr:enoyl-CoA hydratase/isomerase family protein [Burkholderiales bacterium]